ncbi:MAG: hypothetical protein IKQ31_05830 [Clostridia bacterium]|nr:hypothetical protein [Clostridia bacterium]
MEKDEYKIVDYKIKSAPKVKKPTIEDDEYKIVEKIDVEKLRQQVRQQIENELSSLKKREFLREHCAEFRQCEEYASKLITAYEAHREAIISKCDNQLVKMSNLYRQVGKIEVAEDITVGQFTDKNSAYKYIIDISYENLNKEIIRLKDDVSKQFSLKKLIDGSMVDSFAVNHLYGLVCHAVQMAGNDEQAAEYRITREMFYSFIENIQDDLNDCEPMSWRDNCKKKFDKYESESKNLECDVTNFESLVNKFIDANRSVEKSNSQNQSLIK